NGCIRDVGKTNNLRRRIWNHTVPSKLKGSCHRQNWLRQLRIEKLKPVVQILETVPENKDWIEVERKWIRELRAKGYELVNTTEGGEGGATMTGRKRLVSAETRAKISANRRGITPAYSEKSLKARAE